MTRKSAAILAALSLAVLALAALPATGIAAKGGNGGNTSQGGKGGGGNKGGGGGSSSSSLALVVLDPDDGGANFGEQVTFDVSTDATDQPMVQVDCYQGSEHVYWASAGFYEGYPWQWAQNFTLASTYWTGGAASCTAKLYMYDGRRYRDLTSMGFDVQA